MFLKICSLLLVLGLASGAKTKKTAACVKATPMQSFKSASMPGQWFEIKRDSSYDQIESLEGSCTYLNYSVSGSNAYISFSTVLQNRAIKSPNPVKVSTSGQFEWSVAIGPVTLKLDYTILGTDYKNYAVAHACASVPIVGDVQIVWIYSLKRTLTAANLQKAITVLQNNNLDTTKLVDVTQTGCTN